MIWDILSIYCFYVLTWTKCFRYKVVYDTITLTHGQSGCNFYIRTYPGTNHDTAWVAFTSRSCTTYSLSFEWGIRFRFLRWFLLLPLLYRLVAMPSFEGWTRQPVWWTIGFAITSSENEWYFFNICQSDPEKETHTERTQEFVFWGRLGSRCFGKMRSASLQGFSSFYSNGIWCIWTWKKVTLSGTIAGIAAEDLAGDFLKNKEWVRGRYCFPRSPKHPCYQKISNIHHTCTALCINALKQKYFKRLSLFIYLFIYLFI